MRSSPGPALKSVRLLDQVRERIRYLHYSIRTADAYVHWIKAFIRFHDRRHPREMGGTDVEAYLSWLASESLARVHLPRVRSPPLPSLTHLNHQFTRPRQHTTVATSYPDCADVEYRSYTHGHKPRT